MVGGTATQRIVAAARKGKTCLGVAVHRHHALDQGTALMIFKAGVSTGRALERRDQEAARATRLR